MKRAAFFAVALLAELLSWAPLALGFVVGICVAALVAGYEHGRWGYPPVTQSRPFEEDED